MASITIDLSDDKLEKIQKMASEIGISPEKFLEANIENCLNNTTIDFDQATRYVLEKNADLYPRLA